MREILRTSRNILAKNPFMAFANSNKIFLAQIKFSLK
jgi:hypothetical protein